ncbi:hypothetical protein IMSHALPRED_000495 [Imshaugia aleurites]|uniref:Uncharacterized protein n=1 Tax=Imshaugia aleurites TaxID=172621 RepID=A0A8H3J0A0_9LECA|nr:hypothetical protein IMSHALPRED_000495 [Imshaugia aleurites]
MGISDMGDFQYQDLLDPKLLINSVDPAAQGSSFDDIFPFGILGGDSADAPQADATFNFDGFEFDPQEFQGVDGGVAIPTTPLSSFPDQRYVSTPKTQTHASSVWRPLQQPVQQFHYPDPEILSHSTPYYPLQPLHSASANNFREMTPPGQQLSSIDHSLFLHGNAGRSPAAVGMLPYEPIQTYQNNEAFNPEDLALSEIPEDLIEAAIREGWALSADKNTQRTNDPYVPDPGNESDSDMFDSDGEYKPSLSSAKAKTSRRSKPSSKSQARLRNGEVKKGRPCAKPQTAERMKINQRRMDGYYRRKYQEGNLEKARQQSRESYWRRKQRKIEAGEKVKSYKAPGNGRIHKV